ncbi:MAG TPA: restriction endonuclease, partial [Bacteroidia bacterium]|nr:restriction endonuclease [Bacteroidia bacterium]
FALLTIGNSKSELTSFAFFLRGTDALAQSERNFTLSPETIAHLNPNTRTAPVFRSRADAELSTKIYANTPVLIDEGKGKDGNPWGVSFARLFDMASDAALFRTAAQLTADGWQRNGTDWMKDQARHVPLYEAKMISYFDHRFAGYGARGEDRGYRVLPETTVAEHENPEFDPEPFYWVEDTALIERLSEKTTKEWLIGWKDVTAATNERTAIFSLIPRVAVGHTMPLLFTREAIDKTCALYANLNSISADYVARTSVAGLHLTYGYLKQFPILPPSFYTRARLDFIVPRVLELTYTSHSLAPFARDLGYDGPPFPWDEDRRAHHRAELDAFYACAYGLTRDALRYILDPAAVKGPDYPSETFRVLKEKELRHHGEYRTQRLVLTAWDRMEADGSFDALDLGAASDQREVAVSITLPPLGELKDGIWAWPPQRERKDRLRYAAQYALWVSDPKQDASVLRVLVACLAEPALLSGWLSGDERAHWVRLLGPEARPLESGVVRLHPDTNAAWRSAFERLIASGQLREEPDGGWVRGSHFDSSGLSANSSDAQRAAFALNTIRRIERAQLRSLIVLEDNIIWEKLAYGT